VATAASGFFSARWGLFPFLSEEHRDVCNERFIRKRWNKQKMVKKGF
jgi:hypothetical protein